MREYTNNELAKMFKCSTFKIRYIAKLNNIEFAVKRNGSYRASYYSEESFQKIKSIIDGQPERVKVIDKVFNSDELEKEHPLVKDKRCLQLGYWPDIVPKCFEDIDKE